VVSLPFPFTIYGNRSTSLYAVSNDYVPIAPVSRRNAKESLITGRPSHLPDAPSVP